MKFIFILCLFLLWAKVTFARQEEKKIDKKQSPYCVDKLDNNQGSLKWFISNSCFIPNQVETMVQEEVVKPMAMPEKQVLENQVTEVSVEENSEVVRKRFSVGILSSLYELDNSASSLSATLGFNDSLENDFTYESSLGVEKIININSNYFKAKIAKPIINFSLAGYKKINKFSLGIELKRTHYMQFVNKPSFLKFDVTPFYGGGGVLKYSLNENIDLEGAGIWLMAKDDIDSKGFEFSLWGNYKLGRFFQHMLLARVDLALLTNCFDDSSGLRISLGYQYSF